MVPCERQIRDGRQRIHDGDNVVRAQLVLHETHQRLADGHRIGAPHVVVVQEEDEHADVIAIGDQFLIVAGPDLRRRWRTGSRVPVHLDQRELLHRLRLTVFEDLEVCLRERGDRLVFLVVDDHVHAHEVDGCHGTSAPAAFDLVGSDPAVPGLEVPGLEVPGLEVLRSCLRSLALGLLISRAVGVLLR